MTTEEIYIEGLLNYIYCAFDNDIELLMYYDRGASVKTIDDACINVYEKVKHTYPDSICIGVRKDGKKAGYFVYSPGLLISFGLNKKYRDKEGLSEFWGLIVDAIGTEFGCV